MTVLDMEPQVRKFVEAPRPLLIGGKWVDSASGETFKSIDPATEKVFATVARGSKEDVNRAVHAARKAFEDNSPWRRMTPAERGRILHRVGDLILENADELALMESLDNGKPLSVARAADIPLAADLFHYMSGWATKLEGTPFPSRSPLPAGIWPSRSRSRSGSSGRSSRGTSRC